MTTEGHHEREREFKKQMFRRLAGDEWADIFDGFENEMNAICDKLVEDLGVKK